MLLSSGYEFEGYDIVEYVGYESAQVVLGTGFLSALGSSFADLLGTTSNTYENKLANAESICKQKLISKAVQKGCNAIIGIDIDYTTFTNDVMGVIAGGTFVKVIKKVPEKKVKTFVLKRYNLAHSVRCCSANLINVIKENKIYLGVSGRTYSEGIIEAIGVRAECETLFGEKIVLKDIMFADIEFVNEYEYSTEYVEIKIDDNKFKIIKNIDIIIEKYLVDGKVFQVDSQQDIISNARESSLNELRNKNGCDVVFMPYKDANNWKCFCGQTNSREISVCSLCKRQVDIKDLRLVLSDNEVVSSEFKYSEHIAYIMQCSNAKEICDYFKQLNVVDSIIDNEVIPKLEEIKGIERMYGNYKDAAVKFLNEFYENMK